MSDMLRALQLSEVELLKKIICAFEENNIQYYAMAGTLLGAVRHKGFIPWDDDIDIGVPREDYERFLCLVAKKKFPFVTCEYRFGNNPFSYPAKIKDNSIMVTRKIGENVVTEPAWITIFPLDGMPNNAFLRWLHKMNLLMKRYQFLLARSDRYFRKNQKNLPLHKRIAVNLFFMFNMKSSKKAEKTYYAVDKALKKYKFNECDYLVTLFGGYKFKEMFHKKYYQKGKMVAFEDMKLRIPVDSRFILSQLYGDFMTPPPQNKRNGGHGLMKVIINGKEIK